MLVFSKEDQVFLASKVRDPLVCFEIFLGLVPGLILAAKHAFPLSFELQS